MKKTPQSTKPARLLAALCLCVLLLSVLAPAAQAKVGYEYQYS